MTLATLKNKQTSKKSYAINLKKFILVIENTKIGELLWQNC